MAALPDLGFIHAFVPTTDRTRAPLLLLHGTCGNENDLVPFGERLAPGAALISPRGKVSENGAPRFFRRLAEGVFDMADLKARAQELADFVERAQDLQSHQAERDRLLQRREYRRLASAEPAGDIGRRRADAGDDSV